MRRKGEHGYTDDFWRNFNAYRDKGVVFVHAPTVEEHGTVAVFGDLHRNLWDLIQRHEDRSLK